MPWIAIVFGKYPESNDMCYQLVCVYLSAYLFQDGKMLCSKFLLWCSQVHISRCTWQLSSFHGLKFIHCKWRQFHRTIWMLRNTPLCVGDLIRLASFSTILTIKFISISKYYYAAVYRISVGHLFWLSEHVHICYNICVSIYMYKYMFVRLALPWKRIYSLKMTFVHKLFVSHNLLFTSNDFATPRTQWMVKLAFYSSTKVNSSLNDEANTHTRTHDSFFEKEMPLITQIYVQEG